MLLAGYSLYNVTNITNNSMYNVTNITNNSLYYITNLTNNSLSLTILTNPSCYSTNNFSSMLFTAVLCTFLVSLFHMTQDGSGKRLSQ